MMCGGAKDEKVKLVICTTVPETILYILNGQPKYLSENYNIVIVTGKSVDCKLIRENEGVLVYEVPFRRNISLFYDLYAFVYLLGLFYRIKPDIVHSYTPKAGLISMLSSFFINVPVRVHTFTGLVFPSRFGFKRYVLVLMDKIICFCSNKVVAEGLGVKNDLTRFEITRKQIFIIGNGNISGVNTIFFSEQEVSRETAINKLLIDPLFLKDNVVYSFVGRLNIDKGLRELYEAFITLPANSCLLVAGSLDVNGSPISYELLNKIRSHERILYLGFVNDVRLVLKLTSVLVLPSYREGFPNILLQAGSMGVPSIASNINGCNEIVIDNWNGWLVKPMDCEDLKAKMLNVHSYSDSYLKIVKFNARNLVVNKFEQNFYRGQLTLFYKSL